MFGQQAQGGAFAHARIARHQRETALADLLFDAPAEALEGGVSQRAVAGVWEENGLNFKL
jgi:hypothetical protein